MSTSLSHDLFADLQTKKKLAIQALDFDAAEDLDRQIAEHAEKLTADRIRLIFHETLKDVESHIHKYSSIRSAVSAFQSNHESLLRATYQDLLDKAHLQHEKELRNIDSSHGISLIREAEREVSEQIELLEKAKTAAVIGQYSEARRLREEARKVGESEMEARKRRIDQEFSEFRTILAIKHQDAISKITQKWELEMNDLNAEVRARTAETQQRFQGGIEMIRERAAIQFNAVVADEDLKGDELFDLNRKIDEVLRNAEFDRNSIGSVRGSVSPRKSPRIIGGSAVMARKIGNGNRKCFVSCIGVFKSGKEVLNNSVPQMKMKDLKYVRTHSIVTRNTSSQSIGIEI
jgi:hypothetical protein